MSQLKSLALQLPYPVLNAGRRIRGDLRASRARRAVQGRIPMSFEHALEAAKRGWLPPTQAEQWLDRHAEAAGAQRHARWAQAFGAYRNAGESGQAPLRLLWADGPSPGNFGDWLSPYLLHKLTGRGIELVDDYHSPAVPHWVGVGSLAPAVGAQSHVLGAGAAHEDTRMHRGATYHSVRGPHTAAALRRSGGPAVDRFGDLGFILARLYTPQPVHLDAQVLLVRHMNHRRLPLVLADGVAELSIEAAAPGDIERFIDTLCAAPLVVTSAMHCYIACQSYGVPCALVNFDEGSRAVYGDGTKYLDAMAGVGLTPRLPTLIPLDFDLRAAASLVSGDRVAGSVVDDIHEHARQVLRAHGQG
ncbi:MAG: hypothetical protein EOO29_10840 [Comamonadaceae bacterium]|nr:MAG: hypothetical protein EOO29_10840 [Comamonadaceae bacterium]